MKTLLRAMAAVALTATLPLAVLHAAEKGDPKAELKEVLNKVRDKASAGKSAEADFAEEIKALEALAAAHAGEKTNDVAAFQLVKAQIYYQLFQDVDKTKAILEKVKTEFAGIDAAKQAEQFEAAVNQQAAALKIQAALKPGAIFPPFSEKDVLGKPLELASYKGKVVLVDFWATWCGPCVAELPNVLKAYEQFHAKGFEVIGISLDSDKDALLKFTAEKKMGWQQFFDGREGQNKLADQYGVVSIPTTYLLDREGKIIAKELRGEALVEAVGKALEASK